MTRVAGVALDSESGAPRDGKLVTATIYPADFATPPPEIDDGVDRAVTGADGSWELNLRPTAGTGAAIRVRVWDTVTMYLDVPAPIEGGAGDATAIDALTLLVDPDTLEPPSSGSSLYVTRAEVGVAGGVASLGSDGKVPAAQLPPGNGGTDPGANPFVDWFVGSGPPPEVVEGAGLGDMYIDQTTGTLYQLGRSSS